MRDGVCLFVGQVWNGVERAEAAVPTEHSLRRMLDDLLSKEGLASVLSCLRELMCVDEVRVLDGVLCKWCLWSPSL